MEKARKAMSSLLSIIPDFKISCKNSLKLFHSFIRPIALYNSENLAHFTHHQIQAIEENKATLLDYLMKSESNTIHQKFLKFILGVKRNCSNMASLGELGEFPVVSSLICPARQSFVQQMSNKNIWKKNGQYNVGWLGNTSLY